MGKILCSENLQKINTNYETTKYSCPIGYENQITRERYTLICAGIKELLERKSNFDREFDNFMDYVKFIYSELGKQNTELTLSTETISLVTKIMNERNYSIGQCNLVYSLVNSENSPEPLFHKIVMNTLMGIHKKYGNTYFLCARELPPRFLKENIYNQVMASPLANFKSMIGTVCTEILTRIQESIQYLLMKEVTYMVIDTETTGLHDILDDNSARPVQVSYVKFKPNGDITKAYNVFIQQDEIEEGALSIHGLSSEKLRELGAKSETGAYQEMVEDLTDQSTIFIIHNARFDIQVLTKLANRVGTKEELELIDNSDYICTYTHHTKIAGNDNKQKSLWAISNKLSISEEDIVKFADEIFGKIEGLDEGRHLSTFDVANLYMVVASASSRLGLKYFNETQLKQEREQSVRSLDLSW